MEFSKRDTTICKGMAISLMLCHHLFTFPERLNGLTYISLPFLSGMRFAMYAGQFGKLCVALFTLLSGYGIYLSVRHSACLHRTLGRHLGKLYTSYWRIFILAVPISLLLGLPGGHPFGEDLIYCFLGLRFTYCSEWWFVTPFAMLTVASPLICRVIDREKASFLSGFLGLLVFNAFLYYLLPAIMRTPLLAAFSKTVFWVELYTALTLLPAYMLGAMLAKYDVLSAVKARCAGRGSAVAVSLAVLGGLFYLHPFNWLPYDFINAAVFVCCALVLLGTVPGAWLCPVLEKLGEESTYMWLIHTLLCYHWCQKLIFAPKYAVLIFLWLLLLSYAAAKLVRLFYRALAALRRRLLPEAV